MVVVVEEEEVSVVVEEEEEEESSNSSKRRVILCVGVGDELRWQGQVLSCRLGCLVFWYSVACCDTLRRKRATGHAPSSTK